MQPRAPLARVQVPPDPRDLSGEFPFRRPMEVRFGDTDAMGHVNNAVYLAYIEAARVSYFEAATGRDFFDVGDYTSGHIAGTESGIGPRHRWSFILAEARVVYRSPAYFGETLTVETRTCRVGRSSMTMEYRITAQESKIAPGRVIAVADSVMVTYDYDHHTAMPMPDELVRLLEEFEGRPLRADDR